MNFLSEITEREHYFLSAIARFRKNGLPVVLCGNGYVANVFKKFLDKQGVSLYCSALTLEYMPNEKHEHIEVRAIEELVDLPQRFNYIIGFQTCTDFLIEKLQKNAEELIICDPSSIEMFSAGMIDYDFCFDNRDSLQALYDSFGDDFSRKTFTAYLNQRICGQVGHLLPYHSDNAYFNDELVTLGNDEIFVDCGAYDGDTVLSLVKNLRELNLAAARKIYAFEPDSKNFKKLVSNTNHLSNVSCIQSGVWSKNDELSFNESGDQNSGIVEGGSHHKISVSSIDRFVNDEPVTFIKMDIEGAEQQALKGAEATILKHKPLLALSFYHRLDDLFIIPSYIKALHDDYRFCLRWHHRKYAYDLVLYALPY